MEGIDVPGTNPDLLEDEEDFEEMNDDYFAVFLSFNSTIDSP